MDPQQHRIGQDNDSYKSGDSYSKLFAVIKAKVGQWFPFAKRPIDIMTVTTPSSRSVLLKRANDLNTNGYPYPWVRPFAGSAGSNERVVVVNDPQGPFALGILSGDNPATTVSLGFGAHVTPTSFGTYVGMYGVVSFSTTGTAPVAGETLMTVTFLTPLPYVPVVLVQDQNGSRSFGVTNVTVNGFTVTAGGSGLPASTAFTLGYLARL